MSHTSSSPRPEGLVFTFVFFKKYFTKESMKHVFYSIGISRR